MKTGNIDATVAGTLTRKGRGAAAAAGKAQGFADLLAGAEPRHSSKDASRSPTARLHRSEPSVHATTADPTPRRAWSESEGASVPTARRTNAADAAHPPRRLAAPEIRIRDGASRDATTIASAPGHAAPEPVQTGRTAHRGEAGGSGEAPGESARPRPERATDAVSLTLTKTDWPEGNPDRGPTDASLDVPAKPPVDSQAAPASAQAPSSGSGPRRQDVGDTKDAVAAVTPPGSPSQARQPDRPGVTPQREAPGERAPEPAASTRSAVENLAPRDGKAAPTTAGDDRPSISRAAALFPLDDPAAAHLADDRPSDRTANPVLGATPGRADFGQGVSSTAPRKAEDGGYPHPRVAEPVDAPRSPESSQRIAARPGPDDAGKRSPEPLLADGPAEEPIAPSGSNSGPASSPVRVRPGISEAAAYPVPVSPEGLVPDEAGLDTSPEPKTDTNGGPVASVAATSPLMSRPDAELETVDTDGWTTVGAVAPREPLDHDQPPPVTPAGQPERAVAPEDRAQTLDASLPSPLHTAGDDPTPRSVAGESPSHLQPSADASAPPSGAAMVPEEIADTSGRDRETTSTTPPPTPEAKAEPRVPPAPPTNAPGEADGDRPIFIQVADVSVASAVAPSASAGDPQQEPAPEQPAASATPIPAPLVASAPEPTPHPDARTDRPALGMDGEDRREPVSVAPAATIAPPVVSGSGLAAAEPAMRNPIPAEPSMPRKQAPRMEAAPETPRPEAGSPLTGDRVLAVDGAPTSAPQPGERPAASGPILPPVETQSLPADAPTRQTGPAQVPPAPDRNHAPPASPSRILRPEAVSPASAATMPTMPPSTRAERGLVTVAKGADVPPAGPRQPAPSEHDLPASAEVARSEDGSPIRNQAAHDADASRSPTAQALAPTDVEPPEQGAPDPSGSIDAVAAPTTPPRDGAPSPISLETARTVRTPVHAAPHDRSATGQPGATPAHDATPGRLDAASLPRQVPVTAAGSDRSTRTADPAPLATPPPAAPPAEGQPQPAAEAARRMPALATEITIAAARYRYADAGRDEERPSIHSTTRMLAGRLGLSGPSLLVAEPPRFTEPVRPSWAPAYPADMPGSQSGPEPMAGPNRTNEGDDARDRMTAPEPPAPAAPRGAEGARETLTPRPASPPPTGSPAATIASALALDSTWAPQSVAHSAHVSGNHASVAAHTLRIQLNPLHLGVVNATLRLRSSQLEIEVKVENLDAYERLKGEEHVIEKALRAQGYEAPQVTVVQPVIAAPPSAKQDGVLVAGMPQFPGSGASDQETSSGRQRQQGQQEDRNAGSSQANQTSPAHRGSGAGGGGLYI